MKRSIFAIIILAAIVFVLGYLLINKNSSQGNPASSSAQTNLQPQVQDQENVSVEVTPTELSKGKEIVFQVSLNTHSIELSYDLSQISELKDNQGIVYKPISWSGGAGGHHLSGILTFPKLADSANSITLTLKGVANKDRIFQWSL